MSDKPSRFPVFNFDIALSAVNLSLFVLALLFLFVYTEFQSDNRFWLPYIAGISFISALLFILLGKILKDKQPKLLIVFPILTATSSFLTYLFFGSAASPFFVLFFVLFIMSALSHYYAGIALALAGIADTVILFNAGDIERLVLISSTAAFLALGAISFMYGRRLAALVEEGSKASYLAERLIQEKSKEENLLSSMADAVYAVDNDLKIVMFNKAAEELTGLSSKEVIGLHDYEVLKLHDDKGVVLCADQKSNCPIVESWNKNAPVLRDNIYYTSADKKTISLSYSAAPIRDFQGNITGGIAVFRDVTKKKEVERMRNEFVSIASHEMRTPLFAIEGYLSLALKLGELMDKDPKAADYINKARGSVISMSNLLKNLLSFSKIEEGKLQVNAQDFEINKTIKEVIDELLPKAIAKNLVLDFKESTVGELGKKAIAGIYKVHADESMIKEVLLNLVDNSIKFTQKGEVSITLGTQNDFVKICVHDTGPGITEEDQAKLFQKFFRADNTFTREVGGTGLGLYLSREMVEVAGGKIWVESEFGKGSTFCFTLPRVKK